MSTINFIAEAAEPSRASGSMTISWGVLNIPVSIYTGTEETRVSRKEFVDGDVSRPAGRSVIDKSTGNLLTSSEAVIRMAEASNGSFVELSDDELAECTGQKGVAEVLTFVPSDQALRYVPTKVNQVRPPSKKGIPDAASAKAFSILSQAMADKGVCALLRVALRGPAQYALMTCTGDLIFVSSTDGVRKPRPLQMVPVSNEEAAAAGNLVASIGITEAPSIPDVTAEAVQKFVDHKAAGGPQAPLPAAPQPAQVDDMMSLLEQSIHQAKANSPWSAPTGEAVKV